MCYVASNPYHDPGSFILCCVFIVVYSILHLGKVVHNFLKNRIHIVNIYYVRVHCIYIGYYPGTYLYHVDRVTVR